jgi:hypothetical protein
MFRKIALAITLGLPLANICLAEDVDEKLIVSVTELRQSVGEWSVTTEFLAEDESVARAVEGTYSFEWIAEDRVVTGRSAIPELGMQSGILFYVNESARTIEMVSVGPDGRLWIMAGPLGGDTRYSQTYDDSGGGIGQLRFIRYNVGDDRFESRMEYTDDGGETWKRGNHQVFRRKISPPKDKRKK